MVIRKDRIQRAYEILCERLGFGRGVCLVLVSLLALEVYRGNDQNVLILCTALLIVMSIWSAAFWVANQMIMAAQSFVETSHVAISSLAGAQDAASQRSANASSTPAPGEQRRV